MQARFAKAAMQVIVDLEPMEEEEHLLVGLDKGRR